jgi:hypothetical protein
MNKKGGLFLLFQLFTSFAFGVDNLTIQYNSLDAFSRSFQDLKTEYPDLFNKDDSILQKLEIFKESKNRENAFVQTLKKQILLKNPALDFDKILFIKRKADSPHLGLSQNWQGNSSLHPLEYDDAIYTLNLTNNRTEKLFSPEHQSFVGDIDLHFDAKKMIFSMADTSGQWGVYEFDLNGAGPVRLPLIPEKDVQNYDACYVANDDIIFSSTAPITGVPCVQGNSHVSNLYYWKKTTNSIRRLTFDQDHNWCPTMLPNGRILYLRWEYSDLPHFVSRILFHMNPDGTNQVEYYGSNSYWPNSIFYARPIPNSQSKFIGIVTGHHGVRRMGELVLFDSQKGKFEADGVIQRIPGWGKKVEPKIYDQIADDSWPKFLHPFPLNEKYFLVSCQPTPESNWGIYLVDVFDNLLLLKEEPGYALFEPIPLKSSKRPPLIPNRVQPESKTATMYISDIYQGQGLKNVPRDVVKSLRLITYNFAFFNMGGQQNRVGLDGPWDIKEVLGTVPVEEDGSAFFTVPANTPISIQPLDDNNCAVALMRSWTTAMPGEKQSCVGCHEKQGHSATNINPIAAQKKPRNINSWYGPRRGFSFKRELQPVLDAYCIDCHNGPSEIPDFTKRAEIHPPSKSESYRKNTRFSPSYLELRKFVRTPTIESDMHQQPAYEFHANTTRLVQLLKSNHFGVQLDAESWDRVVTWIDLNAPYHGTWTEVAGPELTDPLRNRRQTLNLKYANLNHDPEIIHPLSVEIKPNGVQRDAIPAKKDVLYTATVDGTIREQQMILEVDNNSAIKFVRIPPGKITDSVTAQTFAFEKEFWMGQFEITNEQFAAFDPDHDSNIEHGDFLQFSIKGRGWPLNHSSQPAVRVSWEKAVEFCLWLSQKTGKKITLPTQEQWHYAFQIDRPDWKTDFSSFANLADASLSNMDSYEFEHPYVVLQPWRPSVRSINDGFRVSAPVGSYRPNSLGLYDMIGNVAEWTYSAKAGLETAVGGSWYDRPELALESSIQKYYPWQGVYNVGFRVVISE